MSADINNREYRKNKLKEIISKLHTGQTVEQVKAEFADTFGRVSAEEISQAEHALISEGMPVSEVQRLCDVHASVFKGSIEEIHKPQGAQETPGHPAHTLKAENSALRALMAEIHGILSAPAVEGRLHILRDLAWQLTGIDSHYKVKENLFFTYMEKYGVNAPPKVMWGVDDEIRAQLKQALAALEQGGTAALKDVMGRLEDMAFKEENIMLPILLEKLSADEWRQIAEDTREFGYFLIDLPPAFAGAQAQGQPPAEAEAEGEIRLPTGSFTAEELSALFNALPMDITFVDKDNKVRYFSQGKERVFPRTVSVLGRDVKNCHPPASVHIVEKIVEDLRAGRKDHEDFWIRMGEKLVLIRYFAIRDPEGEFLGIGETTQDIAPLQLITGEKRLMSQNLGPASETGQALPVLLTGCQRGGDFCVTGAALSIPSVARNLLAASHWAAPGTCGQSPVQGCRFCCAPLPLYGMIRLVSMGEGGRQMDVRRAVAGLVSQAVEAVFPQACLGTDDIAPLLELPPDAAMGDFAFPCFQLSRSLRMGPPQIAQKLAGAVSASGLARAEVKGGYLNFFFSRPLLAKGVLEDIASDPEAWGSSEQGKGKTVCIDYSSINIAKRFHIGHLSTTVHRAQPQAHLCPSGLDDGGHQPPGRLGHAVRQDDRRLQALGRPGDGGRGRRATR